MRFRQYYLGCLSHASYLVGDETTGRAVVVDPQRDIDQYVADARSWGLHIELVIETHFHADFLSGHLELAHATGARIAYGPGARADYPIDVLEDGQHVSLGAVDLEVLHTPGHTPESISIVVREQAGDEIPYGVLTGDTLFVGDVGRPDLLVSVGVPAETLARELYRSTHERLLALPDATRVFPAHGAGSACGRQLRTETVSTIGDERTTNYALAPMSTDTFVALVAEGQLTAPPYFAFDAGMNRADRELFDESAPSALTLPEVQRLHRMGAVVLDTRDPQEHARGHFRGSINVPLDGRFAEWAGDVIRPGTTIVLVADPGRESEAKLRLARIGFDDVVGHLASPYDAFTEHPDAVTIASRLTVRDLADRMTAVPNLQIVDVRDPGEYAMRTIDGAVNVPLARVVSRSDELDPRAPVALFCGSGVRSAIAASALRALAFEDVSDLLGGFEAWAVQEAASAPSKASVSHARS